ncbi:hypothetical protein Barb4_04583 [Bacteroidales bacterium Barb4]|nr:hypothetical protein Barb4_04583 [Bacteroidales bacterium Barb4]
MKASPDYGYHFVKWTNARNDSLSSANPFAFALTRDTTLQAHFAKNSYTVILSKVGNGRTEIADSLYSYEYQGTVRVKAFPDYGYHFEKWTDASGKSLSTDTLFAFALTRDTTIRAHFAKNSYRVTLFSAGNGRAETTDNLYSHEYQDTVHVKASPDYGYHFVKWTNARNDSLSSANPLAFALTRDTTLQAHFAKNIYRVTLSADVNNTVKTADGKLAYAYGETVRVEATAGYGYLYLIKWTNARGDSLSSANPFTFVLTRDTTIRAHFLAVNYQVSLFTGKNGTVKSGAREYAYNTQAEVSAEPDTTYHLLKWVNAQRDSLSNANPYRFVVKETMELTAVFERDKCLVTVDKTEGGQVTGSGYYDYNTLVRMEAVADSGHVFTGWMAGDSFNIKVSDRSKFSFTLTEKAFTAYRAVFAAKTGNEFLPAGAEAQAYYADGVLHLVHLEGYFISIGTMKGERVLQFTADSDNAEYAATLPAGVYILNAAKWKERYVVRKFMVK